MIDKILRLLQAGRNRLQLRHTFMAKHSTVGRHIIAGSAICSALVFVCGGWAAATSINGAVVASGVVIVDTEVKRVQHPTGGIVGELLVRDGDQVRVGQILLRLDATVTRANRNMISDLLNDNLVRRARLESERDGGDLEFPAELSQRASTDRNLSLVLENESALFHARRATRTGAKLQLRERVQQLRLQISGLSAQKSATQNELAATNEERQLMEQMFAKQLVALSNVAALRKEAAKLEGSEHQLTATIAEVRAQIAETELQIINVDQEAQSDIARELRDIQTEIAELLERDLTAQDELQRTDIRSPSDGIVHELAFHTVGGVVAPAETIMTIVPIRDALVIEARVLPGDIDQVVPGQEAVVRFSAFNLRTTPELNGVVTYASADLKQEPDTRLQYYSIHVELPAYMARFPGLKLVPGMPVEVYLQTGARTALSYLVKPFTDQINRAFRE